MSSFKKYSTRDEANKASRLFIHTDDGQPTQDWLDIVGPDSDVVQVAQKKLRREMMAFIEKNGADSRKTPEFLEFSDNLVEMVKYSFVTAWSFDEPCTTANVKEFLTSNPKLSSEVDAASGKLGKSGVSLRSSSETTPNTSST